MAQVVLSAVGQTVGGGIGRAIGSTLGQAIDQRVIGSLSPARQVGPRLETLKVQSSADGSPMACVFGRARVTGQVIWAARFLERRNERSGGKGGPRTVDYDYSLSFAVALCEGPIDGVGRVWADGQPLDLTSVTMRVHRGGADQTPDPLIEAVEGTASVAGSAGGFGGAPAYRGVAYVVFEDLALGPFGDRAPQLSFEVFRRPEGDGLEDRLEGVCLIPGAGEFVLATEPVMRREGLTRSVVQTVHNGEGRADLLVSLDQLEAQCPNLKRVSLVIGWFGDDLRAGQCRVRPGVERRETVTRPQTWSVAGLGRDAAHLVSRAPSDPSGHLPHEGGGDTPAYGGTPSDETVRQAVAALKARGWAVTLYPFVFMDIPAGNGRADPYGGAEQAAHPWRGRVKGEDGATATGQVAAMFGAADGWGLRRLALHYARMVAETGADGLLIGSEMRGLTWTRDAAGNYPAVAQYRTLAAECRAIVGAQVELSYAADWSEYFGHQPGDGSVRFHLDPLWADANIDHVGIDWYPPLGDWRGGDGGVDGEDFAGPSDADYLAAQVAGGEGFDWFYADAAARAAQVRTPIVDTAQGEDWVYRPKDLAGWWSHRHHERVGGVRSSVPTAWVPGMKPIRLTEFGCAAVDRGGNAPNLFSDPKSAESALPPFSTGVRDDRMQRRALEAVLGHFARLENNPISAVYGGPMLSGADAWCWDARPYPAFPARADIWADAGAWATGHWLNGRLAGEGRDLLAAILRRGGLGDAAFEIGSVKGDVSGYVIDRPMRTRDALEPLLGAFDQVAAERDGRVAVIGDDVPGITPGITLGLEALALPDDGAAVRAERTLEPRPGTARVRFIDEGADYQTGSVTARAQSDDGGGSLDLDLPAVCSQGLALTVARRALGSTGQADRLTLALGPLEALRLEPGDVVAVEGQSGAWRIERLDIDETPTASLTRLVESEAVEAQAVEQAIQWRPGETPPGLGAPFLALLDLPPLPGHEDDVRPIAAVAADPWRPMVVLAGPTPEALTSRAVVESPARVGTLTQGLSPGVLNRWDEVNAIVVRIEGAAPSSVSQAVVLAGGNAVAVQTASGWEIVQYRTATLIGEDVWRLSGLLRGQQGTDDAHAVGASVGAVVVCLDPSLPRVAVSRAERGLPLIWRAGPAGAVGGVAFAETTTVIRGVSDRPWSPAHLTAIRSGIGVDIRWLARSRLGGDVWDGDVVSSDPMRFRVRILDGAVERRVIEANAPAVVYAGAEIATDFPGGVTTVARIAVAQGNDAFGWGVEASVAMPQ